MTLFGSPVIFCIPNLGDTKQLLLLKVHGSEICLDDRHLVGVDLPRYRDMMRRVARDPVGQTRVFELIMRLFFVHVLGVRPECLHNRRRAGKQAPREWCTDGIAASSSAPGIVGPVHAFRGEIEAQGRGSLHPHILVWLVGISSLELLRVLKRDTEAFSTNLANWMKATILAIESTTQSSVQALPRRFGEVAERLPALPFSMQERSLSRFDGGSELDVLREESARGVSLSREQEQLVEEADPELWRRPSLALRDAAGVEVAPDVPTVPRVSVYTKPLNEFAVSCCPSY